MQPNLARISSDGDGRAEQILARTPSIVDGTFLASVDQQAGLDLGRFGVRQTTFALRERSEDRLLGALLATALSAAIASQDARDLMVSVALAHVVAQELGIRPADLFERVADRLPGTPVSGLLRGFGGRQDITLSGFGWGLVETEDGPDFAPI